jgi:hypothetical protein
MRILSQNLNEDEHYRPKGSRFWHGRAWLMFKRIEWHVEWLFGKRSHLCLMHLNMGYGDSDNGVLLAVNIPYLFGIYIGVEGLFHSRKRQRQIGWSWHDDRLHVSIWEDPMQWNNSDPKWWSFSICPVDILLGEYDYSTRDINTERVIVGMPEGPYPCTVRIFESTYKRPRWHWPRRIIRANITPDTPIPHPGKGENSWDCDEDATWSMTCPAESGAEAALYLQTSILRDRNRYGGDGWLPSGSTRMMANF